MKRSLALLGTLLTLSGCASLCDCTQQKVAQSEESPATGAANSATIPADPAVGSDGTVLSSRQYREATPVGETSRVDQLAQVAADPTAKPFLPVAEAPRRLVRKMLPSEFPQAGMEAGSMSAYPSLPHSKKQLSDYARQIGFQLASFESLRGAKVGVTTFVEFDDSLENATPLGNQFAEALVSTLPVFGVQVVEFKKTKAIKVSPRGDFSLSRDVKQLSDQVGMDYVLVGTLVATRRGIQVHSRVVSVRDAGIVASASTLLPHLVLQQIQP